MPKRLTTSERQAQAILDRHRQRRAPSWVADPQTGAEQQAAALLTEKAAEADPTDARTTTERQVSALRPIAV